MKIRDDAPDLHRVADRYRGGDFVDLVVRRACGSRAVAARRERCRRPAARPIAAAPRAPRRARTRSSAAPRAAARRRRRARPSPRRCRRSARRGARRVRARRRRAASAAPGSAPARRGRARASPRARRASACPRAARAAADAGAAARRGPRGPTTMPACGPPSSLSPEKVTRSAPAARVSLADGSSPVTKCLTSTPEPRSSTSGSSWRCATRRELRERRQLGEADDAEVRLVHAQDQRRLGADRALVVGARACGSSSRPRAAARPSARARPGCGSRRRSRSARRARRAPRVPPPARRARAAPRPRCCSRRAPPRRRSAGAGCPRRGPAASRARPRVRSYSRFE